jgi:tungstate transport system substrate-binding protein
MSARSNSSTGEWFTETRSRLMAFAVFLVTAGCDAPAPPAEITLATTTSTQDSGLLDELLPAFTSTSGIRVNVIAVGSGQAMELGRRGDADILLTHSPAAEEEFMAQGWGASRRRVMHNEFVLLGPPDDPADIESATTAAEAFRAIAGKQAPFVSRGDESGTHQRERQIWKKAAAEQDGAWYVNAGAGMAQALRMANEMRAYVLSDRATFLALRSDLELTMLLEGDPQLRNEYSVITVNPTRHPHVHRTHAERLREFLLSEQGRQIIGQFGVEKYGERLFVPETRQ